MIPNHVLKKFNPVMKQVLFTKIPKFFKYFAYQSVQKIASVTKPTSRICSWMWKFSLTWKKTKTWNYYPKLLWKLVKVAVGWETSFLAWFKVAKILFHGPFEGDSLSSARATYFSKISSVGFFVFIFFLSVTFLYPFNSQSSP